MGMFGSSQKVTSSFSEKAMEIHTASYKLDDDRNHMTNNEKHWRSFSLGPSSHDKAILPTSKSSKETVHCSVRPEHHHRADQIIGPASMCQPFDIGEVGITSTRTTCEGIHRNFTSEGFSGVSLGQSFHNKAILPTSKSAKETVHYSLHPENRHRADQNIGPASMSQLSDIGEVGITSTRTTCEGIIGNFTSEGSSRVVGANEDPISGDLFPVTAPIESQGNKGKRPRESLVDNVIEATQISKNHDSLIINHHSYETSRSGSQTIKSAKETVHYSLRPEIHHRADQRIGPASMRQPSDIGQLGIASTRTTCEGIHGNLTSEGSSRVVGANEDSISGDLFPVTAPNETQGNKGKRPGQSLVVNVTEATEISNNHDSLLINHHSNETSRSGSQTSKSAKETVHYSLHPENHHLADQSICPASMSQPSDIGEVGIPSTRTTYEGIHGNFTSEGFSRGVGANEDSISGDLVPVTAPNESQGNKGKRPREESLVVNLNHDSLLINQHSNETSRSRSQTVLTLPSEVDASHELSKSKSPSNSCDVPVSVEPLGEVTRDRNTLAPSLPMPNQESNAFPQRKKARHTIFPKDVPSLLITGILDGAPVFYYDYKAKVKKWALIKQDCYLCGCLKCRFLRPVSACEFVQHCGISTRRANTLIFFKSGFSVDRVVKQLQKTPPEKMFESLVSLTDSAINEQNFRNWSWRSNVDASNQGADRGTQHLQPIEKQGTRS